MAEKREVILRMVYDGPDIGKVIAVFPDKWHGQQNVAYTEEIGLCTTSYEHYIIPKTKPLVNVDTSNRIVAKLRALGFDVTLVKRMTKRHRGVKNLF